MTAPADLTFGSFSDEPPWLVDPDEMPWRRSIDDRCGGSCAGRCPSSPARVACPAAPGCSASPATSASPSARGPSAPAARAAATSKADISRRLRIAAEHLGPDLHQARPDHLQSARASSPRSSSPSSRSAATRSRPSRGAAVRAVVESELGRPLDEVFAEFDRDAAGRRVDRPGPRGHAAHRRAGRRQGAAPVGGHARARRPRVMAWLAPFLVGRIPIAALANPPALVELFAETITEELDFRLEAENMLDVARSFARSRPARLRGPPPPPRRW